MTVTFGSVEQLLDLYQVEGKTVAILVEGPDGLPRLGGCDMLRVYVWTEGEGYLVARRQVEGAIVHLEISSLRRVAASILKYRRGGLIGSLSRAQVLYCADPGAEVLIQLLHKGVTARPLSNQQKMLRRKRAQSGLYDAWKYLTVKKEPLIARYGMNRHFFYMLHCYYQLNQRLVPDAPDTLSDLKEHNPFLYDLCVRFLAANDLEEKYTILERMVKYIVEPHGGFLPEAWSIPLDQVPLRDLLTLSQGNKDGEGQL